MPAPAPLPVLTRAFDGVVVTDIRMPDMDGLQLFQRLRDLDAEIPVILITGHGDIATAVQCMREGAWRLPGQALSRRAPDRHHRPCRREAQAGAGKPPPAGSGFASGADAEPFIGNTPAMLRIKQTLRHIADADVDVLVEGETGTARKWSPAHCIV